MALPHANGRVGKNQALQAWVATFGPLPGVRRDRRVRPARDSATGVVRWVLARMDELTPRQRRAVRSYLRRMSRPATTRPSATASEDQAEFQALLDEAVRRIAAKLGFGLEHPAKVVMSRFNKPNGASATNSTDFGMGRRGPCEITLWKRARAKDLYGRRSLMVHEAFHCFQQQITDEGNGPAWLWEGSAEWVEAKLGAEWNPPGYRYPFVTLFWSNYLKKPGMQLFRRAYSALGFYAHLEESGGDPWSAIPAMLRAGDSNTAYALANAAAGSSLLRSWASGFTRRPALGREWDTVGPQIPSISDYGGPPIARQGVRTGGQASIGVDPRANGLLAADLRAEVVTLRITPRGSANGRLRAADGTEHPLRDQSFCTKPGGCTCAAGETELPKLARGKALLAMTGGDKDTVARLRGTSLAQYCRRRRPPPPPGGTNITITGAANARFTSTGRCHTRFGYFFGAWSVTGPGYPRYRSISIKADPYRGPAYYKADTVGVPSIGPEPPHEIHYMGSESPLEFSSGWRASSMPRGSDAGGFTVLGQTGAELFGTVDATLLGVKRHIPWTVGHVRARGTWRCSFER